MPYRTETTLSQDGKLSVKGLPFRKGDKVEVSILMQKAEVARKRYPLRGKPFTYQNPFEGVAEEDWDAKVAYKEEKVEQVIPESSPQTA